MRFVLTCTVVVLYGFVMCVCVCVWECVCVGLCGFCLVWVFGYNVHCTLTEVFLNLTEVFLTLTEVFLTLTGFSVLFPQLQGKRKGKTRKDGARSALFHISCYLCCSVVICVVL
jgi:hypothetical protein